MLAPALLCQTSQGAVFSYQPTLASVSPRAVSLAGGLPVTLSLATAGSGPLLQPDTPAAHAVTVGAGMLGPAGLPCPVVNVSSTTTLTCTAPPLTGWILAEIWNLAPFSGFRPLVESFNVTPSACGAWHSSQ